MKRYSLLLLFVPTRMSYEDPSGGSPWLLDLQQAGYFVIGSAQDVQPSKYEYIVISVKEDTHKEEGINKALSAVMKDSMNMRDEVMSCSVFFDHFAGDHLVGCDVVLKVGN